MVARGMQPLGTKPPSAVVCIESRLLRISAWLASNGSIPLWSSVRVALVSLRMRQVNRGPPSTPKETAFGAYHASRSEIVTVAPFEAPHGRGAQGGAPGDDALPGLPGD